VLTSEFVTAVRRQGKITTDTTDAEILATGDMEIQGRLIPMLRLSHQEYFVAETTTASFNGRVQLPPRSILGAVRHVQLLSGGQTQRLPQVSLESDFLGASAGLPESWYFDGGALVLLPRGTNGTVRLRYYLRPSRMVLNTDLSVARVTVATAVSGGYTLTLSGAPVALTLDVVSNGASHQLCGMDLLAFGAPSLVMTSAEVMSPIAVGDWVCAAGQTPVVPVPEELFSNIVHQTAYVVLRSLGYDDEANSQKVLASESFADARLILAPRSEGNPKRLTGGIRRALGAWRR
jgi:hypothetical protein